MRSYQLEEERSRAPQRELGVVDLNRSLPPLPGLDQYKAPKEPKMHIAHLLAGAVGTADPSARNDQMNAADTLNQGILYSVGAGFGPAITSIYYDNEGGAEVYPVGRVPDKDRSRSLTQATANSSLHMNSNDPFTSYSTNGLSSVTTFSTYDQDNNRQTMSTKDHKDWHRGKEQQQQQQQQQRFRWVTGRAIKTPIPASSRESGPPRRTLRNRLSRFWGGGNVHAVEAN